MCELQSHNRQPWLPVVNSKTKQKQITYTDCCIFLRSKWHSHHTNVQGMLSYFPSVQRKRYNWAAAISCQWLTVSVLKLTCLVCICLQHRPAVPCCMNKQIVCCTLWLVILSFVIHEQLRNYQKTWVQIIVSMDSCPCEGSTCSACM